MRIMMMILPTLPLKPISRTRTKKSKMNNINIEATERSPQIDFNFQESSFSIRGESYPEDVSEFYGDIIDQFNDYVSNLEEAEVTFDFELIYFNSSTAKVLMGLFDQLDEVASNGNKVVINWCYEEDDDNMEELGEEFGEDLEHAEFNMLPKAV